MSKTQSRIFLILGISVVSVVIAYAMKKHLNDPKRTEIWKPIPAVVTPGINMAAPSDAIQVFTGKDLSQWQHKDGTEPQWVIKDNAFTVSGTSGDLYTKQTFGDCQLHIEWRVPAQLEGKDQQRGNSGIFLQARYEVQILDSYENPTYVNGQAASIYKQYPPLVNASRKPGEWQSYDIIFTAPRFDDTGKLLIPAYMTVFHNGVLVQNHAELKGSTAWIGSPEYNKHPLKEPIMLQHHGSPVSFRNIWIREL